MSVIDQQVFFVSQTAEPTQLDIDRAADDVRTLVKQLEPNTTLVVTRGSQTTRQIFMVSHHG